MLTLCRRHWVSKMTIGGRHDYPGQGETAINKAFYLKKTHAAAQWITSSWLTNAVRYLESPLAKL